MCKCIDNLLEQIATQKVYRDVGEIENVDFVDRALIFTDKDTEMKTISHLELSVVGKKKKVIKSVMHTYCPFCGGKY